MMRRAGPRAPLALCFCFCFSLSLVVAASPVQAQDQPATRAPSHARRAGLILGIGAGGGSLQADCSDCSSTFAAGGLDGFIGGMLTPRLAILGEVWAMVHHETFLTVWQNLAVLAGRFWPTPNLWLQLGLGSGTAGYSWHGIFVNRTNTTETSPGVMAGAGYEFYVRNSFAIDIELQVGTGFYGDKVNGQYQVKATSASLGAGFNWY